MKKKSFRLLMAVRLLLLVGCQATNTPISTITPSQISNTASPEPSLTPTPTEAYQYPTLNDVLKDKNYLQDCRDKYPPIYTEQVGFRGIYPGITTGVEMRKLLGEPDNFTETSGGGAFGYSDFNGLVSVKNLVVDGITIDPKSEGLTSLKLILDAYGCPDVIGAKAMTDDPFATSIVFNKTYLWYVHAGVWVRFEGYPIEYSQPPNTIGFESLSLLKSVVWFDERSKPVTFAEAMVER